jgi:hypothetical protein
VVGEGDFGVADDEDVFDVVVEGHAGPVGRAGEEDAFVDDGTFHVHEGGAVVVVEADVDAVVVELGQRVAIVAFVVGLRVAVAAVVQQDIDLDGR